MKTSNVKIDKKDLNKIFWRSMCVNASFNYERHMSQGVQFALSPVLKRLYPEKNDFAKSMVRHSEFFNSTPVVIPFILGVTLALEEENAKDPNFDESSINAIKVSLMGPLAGIGDSIFWGTLRPLAGGIACSLAMSGNAIAPLIFLLIYNIPHILTRYYGLKFGYSSGVTALNQFTKMGLTQKIFQIASIVGLLVIGGMVSSMVSVNLALTIGSGESAIALNDVINGIMPQMLSLLVTYVLYVLIKRGMKTNILLVGILLVSIVGSLVGIF